MSSARLTARFSAPRGSPGYGVPSGSTTSQNILATDRRSLGLHGRRQKVVGSGIATMSLSSMRANPSMDDPSKPIPSAMPVSSSSTVMAKLLRKPRTSVNQRRMNFTSCSSAASSTSAAVCVSTLLILSAN